MMDRHQTLAEPTVDSTDQVDARVSQPQLGDESPKAPTVLEKVLVLDGNTRSALAVTRSLGRRGVHVVVAGDARWTLSSVSKYCHESFVHPPLSANPDAFIAAVIAECSRRDIRIILPMTDVSTATLLRHRDRFARFNLPFVEFDRFDALTDKVKLLALARQFNISVPQTHFISDPTALDGVYPKLIFPVVLKPCRSWTCSNEGWVKNPISYARSLDELKEAVGKDVYFSQYPFLIQEHISGRTCGIFALYDHGRPVAFFSHRRIRERPPSGGVSVLSESAELDPQATTIARTILHLVSWHGVVMVEFKISDNGTPYLIEVNGRFWGSLQLAIDAGVDFPWLLYQLATGRDLDNTTDYAVGVRCRWLLGDLASLCKTLMSGRSSRDVWRARKVRSILQFLNPLGKSTRYEVNRWDDMKPFLFELGQCLGQLKPKAH